GQTVERSNSCLYQPMTRLVVQVGYKAKPAAVAFVGVSIKSCVGAHRRGLVTVRCGRRHVAFRGRYPLRRFGLGKTNGQIPEPGVNPGGWQSRSLGSRPKYPGSSRLSTPSYVLDNTGPPNAFNSAMRLNTERLILRQWRDSDLTAFARLNDDPAVMEFMP